MVSFTVDPTPALAGGSAPIMASVAGLLTMPRPAAIVTIDARIGPTQALSTPRNAACTKPRLISARPVATTRVVPKRRMNTIDSGAKTPVTGGNGTVRTPASRAE